MIISDKTVWVIMSKDRQYIARGTPRNRYLVRTDDDKNIMRYLTYSTKGKAEAGFKVSGFYGQNILTGSYGIDDLSPWLEAVEVRMLIETIPSEK